MPRIKGYTTLVWMVFVVTIRMSVAHAQSGGAYTLIKHAIAGGGATLSSGGAYGLGGTVGQLGTSSSGGGSYLLQGGFWDSGDRPVTDVPGEPAAERPLAFRAYRIAPNPFASVTTVSFDLPAPRHVTVRIFDLGGHLVRVLLDDERPAGRHRVLWNAADPSRRQARPGVYFVNIRAGDSRDTQRIVLLE